VCLVLISIASVPSFRNRKYELFRIIHFGCSTSICILLWLHLSTVDKVARIQASLALCVWVATYTHRNLLFIYRNFSLSKPNTRIVIENIHNMLKVDVILPRPWKVRPGQYVYLTTARPGLFSIFQRHPFLIASSESADFEIRIHPEAGFTRRLLGLSLGEATYLRAFIEGPYGHSFDLQDYGTVILLASGIGIVGHLPYIQALVQDYKGSKTKTRDLLLIWSVETRTHRDLVSKVMDDILREDDLPTVSDTPILSNSGKYSKKDRYIEDSNTADRPGLRPAPHGENVSISYNYR
jgi:predicted ferric reductase